MKLSVLTGLVGLLLTYSQVSIAKEYFHCGNDYQDTPCRANTVNKTSSEIPSSTIENKVLNKKLATPAINAECKQRGETAKNIAQLRESGKSEEQLLTELKLKNSPDTKITALIKDVYGRHGAAIQIQYAIEHECMQVIVKAQLSKKQLRESEKLRGNDVANTINESKPQPSSEKTINQYKSLPSSQAASENKFTQQDKPTAAIQPALIPVTVPETSKKIPIAQAQPASTAQAVQMPVATPVPSKQKSVQQIQPTTTTQPVQLPVTVPEPIQQITAQQIQPAPATQLAQSPVAAPIQIKQTAKVEEKHEQGDELGVCNSFKNGLDNINIEIKKGGDSALIKDLKLQKNKLKQEMKSSGC